MLQFAGLRCVVSAPIPTVRDSVCKILNRIPVRKVLALSCEFDGVDMLTRPSPVFEVSARTGRLLVQNDVVGASSRL